MENNNSNVAYTSQVHRTKDYDSFKFIVGNRPIVQAHVNELVRSITENGNLSTIQPIKVNADMEVFDGQHTLKALEKLGMDVYYQIIAGMTGTTMKVLNLHHRNWSWKDWSYHYATNPGADGNGNPEYIFFNQTIEDIKPTFTMALLYATGSEKHGRETPFYKGELVIKNKQEFRTLLEGMRDVYDESGDRSLDLARGYYQVATTPGYDHQAFMTTLATHKRLLNSCYSEQDYKTTLWEINDIGSKAKSRATPVPMTASPVPMPSQPFQKQ